MPGFVDYLINHVISSISTIRDRAAQHNGQCTWHFSQCFNPVRPLIAKSARTRKGICEILSAKWVCEGYHGRSLETWLTAPAGGLDLAKLSLLAQVFGTGRANQAATTEAWIRANGVAPRNFENTGGAANAAQKFEVDDDLLGDLSGKFNNINFAKPLFALIDVEEDNQTLGHMGHTMAVKAEPITAASFLYFDPNYGEFRFNSWNGFKDWFLWYFRKSHYRYCMGKGYRLRYF